MSAVATQLRIEVAEILKAAGLNAFPQMPATLIPGMVVILPDSPYGKPYGMGDRPNYVYQMKVACHANVVDLDAGLADVEELAERVCEALPAGVDITTISEPRTEPGSTSGPIYVSDVFITVTGRKEGKE